MTGWRRCAPHSGRRSRPGGGDGADSGRMGGSRARIVTYVPRAVTFVAFRGACSLAGAGSHSRAPVSLVSDHIGPCALGGCVELVPDCGTNSTHLSAGLAEP